MVLALACACGGTQVKQKVSDDADLFQESSGVDMEQEPTDLKPNIVTKSKRKGICCTACDKAMANDRTGDTADKIPCADFTAELDEDCLKFFRNTPMMASNAKACAGGSKPPATPAP